MRIALDVRTLTHTDSGIGNYTLNLVRALGLVLRIGLTRIYLSAHYVSDVRGAMAGGVAWLAACLPAVDTLRRRHMPSR